MSGNPARQAPCGEDAVPAAGLLAAGQVPRIELSDGRDSIENWRQNVASLWHIEAGPDTAQPFVGRSVVHNLGRMIMGQVTVSGHRVHRDPRLIGRMGVDHVLVQLRMSGTFHGVVDGRELRAKPGDLTLFDMSRPFEAWNTDYTGITLALPRNLVGRLAPVPDEVHGLVLPSVSPLGSLLAHHVRLLAANADRFDMAEAAAMAQGTALLIASCLEPSLPRGTERVVRHPRAPVLLLLIRRFIDERLHEPELSVDGIAAAFGLSRTSLYRLFRPLGSVAQFIRTRRLAGAYRDLTRPGSASSVQEVGFRWCLGGPSVFNVAFRRAYGVSPGEARYHASCKDAALLVAKGGEWRNLENWVAQLDSGRDLPG